ncbi:MarR family winged helix-turn-helix transcriptional regulator [uncultured Sphingomonas sp.]|uniref:MarR family winged helix-turn-helix transcriptional regulator n=1 Tax=uncultured Sphingomonas sp. TaxID=158754 RepID=UPI0035C95B80
MKASPDAIADLVSNASSGGPRNAIGFVLWRIMHRYQREVDRVLLTLDLTHLQFVTLVLIGWLGRGGGQITQADVARFGDIHRMQVSNIVKALVDKGLVCRERIPQGGPARSVAITTVGLDRLRSALPAVADVQQQIFGEDGKPGGDLLNLLVAIDSA